MKIIDYNYVIPSIIIFIGTPLLLYIKLSRNTLNPLDITIYGSTIQTAILAYYIDKNIEKVYGKENKKYLNITIVSPFDPPHPDRLPKQTDKNLITFCGVENHLLSLLKDLDMQFEMNEYGIYFSQIKEGRGSPLDDLETYKILQQYPLRSLFDYGLSHITAKNLFQKFQSFLSQQSRNPSFPLDYSASQLSMSSSLRDLFPYQYEESGIKYLSETIGLDQQYIHDYIMPVVWGSYLHQANSITTMLKLLPLYCTKNKLIGSSLGILVDENAMYEKIKAKIKYLNLKHVYNHYLQEFKLLHGTQSVVNQHQVSEQSSQQRNHGGHTPNFQIYATFLNTFINQTKEQQEKQHQEKEQSLSYSQMKTNLLFIIEDYEMVNKKQISYYKTIVDGKIKNDEKYPKYFTLFFTYEKKPDNEQQEENSKNTKYIYSATRLCKENCKNFNKNVYVLISKQKLTEKDLGIFEQHHIIYYKKYWLPKTQLPSTKRFEEIENVYRVYDTESISDSYQFKLHVLDSLSHVVINKMQLN